MTFEPIDDDRDIDVPLDEPVKSIRPTPGVAACFGFAAAVLCWVAADAFGPFAGCFMGLVFGILLSLWTSA
jgi:hypothetical protein